MCVCVGCCETFAVMMTQMFTITHKSHLPFLQVLLEKRNRQKIDMGTQNIFHSFTVQVGLCAKKNHSDCFCIMKNKIFYFNVKHYIIPLWLGLPHCCHLYDKIHTHPVTRLLTIRDPLSHRLHASSATFLTSFYHSV